jgi:hypothetical protein
MAEIKGLLLDQPTSTDSFTDALSLRDAISPTGRLWSCVSCITTAYQVSLSNWTRLPTILGING